MADYRITGIWKDSDGVITHYAMHLREKKVGEENFTLYEAEKVAKDEAVKLLLNGNTAKTYMWNYKTCRFDAGADVQVIEGSPLFLRSDPDGTEKDNLSHLINYGYIF
ncbi:DUF3892 domain-containing protein [Chryseobacterium culicis]|uniref:DUF3892 domain-containing protein n=1 Tax=Chryseobacterium culicis TaxID=680127 RepID=UPI00289CAA40|nr:DUF3892 domain-containing protein [Chryseobacterium culicis]